MSEVRLNLSAVAIRRAPLTVFLIVLFMAAGLAAYFNLGRQEDPVFTMRVMVINAQWPGATASEVELQLVDKLERKLQETPHLKATRSYSKPGQATVFVELMDDFPAKEVSGIWYQVRKKIGDIQSLLPAGTIGPFFNDEFGDTHIATYALTGAGFTMAEIKDQADVVRNRLLMVPGVEKVDLIGVEDERIFIEIDSARLAQLGISANQITQAVAQQNNVTPTGVMQLSQQQLQVRTSGTPDSVAAIQAIPLAAGSRTVRLGDVAQVTRGYADPPTYRMRFQGEQAVGLGVVMSARENVVKVGHALDTAIGELATSIPRGIQVHKATYQPTVVTGSVNEFLMKFALAIGIVLAVSFVSLGLRSGIVVALSIPLVLAVTFVVMWYLDISFQRISLGALIISLGLLVDDAMISVEMMQRKLEEGSSKLEAATYAYKTTAFPMLTGTLITIAGFMPPFLAKSTTGEYVGSLFIVVGVAMLVSWFVAVYFTPYLGTLILKENLSSHQDHFHTPFYTRLRTLIERCLHFRKTAIAATVALFIAGGVGMGTLEQQFFPYSTRDELLVDLWLPEGATFAESERRALELEAYLRDTPEVAEDVAHVATYVGGGAQRFYLSIDQQLINSNFSQLIVTAKGLKARERLVKAVRNELATQFTGVRSKVDRLPSGPPTGWPVQIRVSGPDHAEVRRLAEEVKQKLRVYPDAHNVHDDWHERVLAVRLEIDQDRARMLGVSNETLNRALAGALSGGVVSAYRETDKTVLIELRSPMAERSALSSVNDVYVPIGTGRLVPLSQLAKAVPVFEEGVLWRRNRVPTITVQAEATEGLQAPEVTAKFHATLDELIGTLPTGYQIIAGGSLEESVRAGASVQVNLPLVYIATFLLLLLQLNNLKKSVLVLVTAPLGIIGAAAALHLTGQPFGFVAILGLNALSGMIMRNSVILVDQVSQDIAAGADTWTAILEATVRRFRPIALTASAAVLAFIPLTQSTLWGPMAIALIGGLIVATILTITFLPALYAAWFKAKPPTVKSADAPSPSAPTLPPSLENT